MTDNIHSGNDAAPGSKKKNRSLLIAGILFLVFFVYYSVMAVLAPGKKIREIESEFGFKPPENTTIDDRIFTDSVYVRLHREKSFLQARITMAETDSISLSLNLPDSSATLEINGVAVNRTRISGIRMSRVFRKTDEYALTSLLSEPFTISRDYSSIEKEPLMLKIAPKDTSEYKPDILPDTSNTTAVNYILVMENGFRIYVYQETGDGQKGSFARLLFDMGDRFRNSWHILKNIVLLRVPEYHPYIKITLPMKDARNIYRGLPRSGQVAVYR